MHIKNAKLLIILICFLLTLANSLSANADNTKNNNASGQSFVESPLSTKKEDAFTIQILENILQLRQDFGETTDALQDKLFIESNIIRTQFIKPDVSRYKLESRNFSELQHYTFEQDVKPILTKKCLACHGCYDAPCQLKMESASGLERGASKIKIYDGSRLKNLSPTRLNLDFQRTKDWREHGFYPVLNSYEESNKQKPSPLMLKMLDLARKNPLPINKAVPQEIELGLTRSNSCPDPDEFSQYAKDNPHGGMPLAVTGLSKDEYKVLSTWLTEGAKINTEPVTLSLQQQGLINRWESWLNREDKRSKLVSRYLYEHLFLAHLHFEEGKVDVKDKLEINPLYFKLIRSSTPPGKKVLPVKTTRPNDAVNGRFFYRLQPISDTLINKTHIVYAFGEQRLSNYKQLFFSSDWSLKTLPGYSEAEKGNPFETFKAIPAKIRYQFLLNDAAFFVRNFIRGPVCRGQVATDVIRDQFWIMFEAPEYERYTNNQLYQKQVNALLGVPGQNVSLTDFGSEWYRYHRDRNDYINKRQQEYNNFFPAGARYSHIWNGNKNNKNAFQTIFRHHDSASIVQGWHGAIPQTSWLLDYPLLERTIYELVVGFNVFGNVSHQAQTRLYFDLIRNEGETNFLRFMPIDARSAIYENWYKGSGKLATLIKYHDLDTKTASAIKFNTNRPYNELLKHFMNRYPLLTQANDEINRCNKDCIKQKVGSEIEKINQSLRILASSPAKHVSGIQWLPDVSFLRINLSDNEYIAYSLIRNRMHSNVAFMLGESLRLEKSLDSLTIMPTLIGSYPNLMFQVNLQELEKFAMTLSLVNTDNDFEKVISQWGVRRMSPNFWEIFHSFHKYMEQHKPLEAGIYDLNRYGYF